MNSASKCGAEMGDYLLACDVTRGVVLFLDMCALRVVVVVLGCGLWVVQLVCISVAAWCVRIAFAFWAEGGIFRSV